MNDRPLRHCAARALWGLLWVGFHLPAAEEAKPPVGAAIDPPLLVETQHEGRFGGQAIRYTARAAEMQLTDQDGKPAAALFHVAYLKDGGGPDRPLSFVFNGGPGSASVWLHMGLLGPQRVIVPSEADSDDGAAPYRLVDNPSTLLDLTDLVFVDPIGTGYSRVIGEGKTADYWSMNGDTASIAQFIRRFVTEQGRWNAPKYLIGESFGSTRAAAVAGALMDDGQDMALNGIVMISQAMDYTGSTPTPDNLIAYVTYLPTMAATARYHGKAGQGVPLTEWVESARRFATNEYLPALFRGSALAEAERTQIAQSYAQFTGLPLDYVLRAHLRVTVPRFSKELLRERGEAVGRLDSRYVADEADDTADQPHLGDAASNAISSAYTAAINDYLRRELKVEISRPYLTSNDEVGRKWNYRSAAPDQYWEPAYVNTARALSDALRKNADLRVLVANGYYDLVTPFFDAEYTVGRHAILRDRIQMSYYEAGHMMYVRQADFEALIRDMRAFYAE
jgi:carboxypeptidase C (cathepsin A)